MSSLEVIDWVTYVCAALGGILLLLCIILAGILIYLQCRKHFFPGSARYVVVPAENEANIENGYIKQKQIKTPNTNEISVENEKKKVAITQSRSNELAPVRKKMRWKLTGRKKSLEIRTRVEDDKRQQDDVSFSQEDLDVPRQGLFKKNNSTKNVKIQPRISKSDWDISSNSSAEEELFLLRDMKQGPPQDRDEVVKSQYFDALDTIVEVHDEEEEEVDHKKKETKVIKVNNSDDDWEDIEDDSDKDPVVTEKVYEKQTSSSISGSRREIIRNQMRHLSPSVNRRVAALRKLHLDRQKLETNFHHEVNDLERNVLAERLEPLLDMRSRIVSGRVLSKPDQTSQIGDSPDQTGLEGSGGIPMFWAHAMLCSQTIRNIVQDHDVQILKHLQDIRVILDPHRNGSLDFRLVFQFDPNNQYFSNSVLTKDYQVRMPSTGSGPEVVGCKGCKINWHKGKNVTIRQYANKKHNSTELVHKSAPPVKRNSFFNFFSPPKVSKENSLDLRVAALLDAHFDIGLYFKEIFVPKATVFFMSSELVDLRGSGSGSGGSNRNSMEEQQQHKITTSSNKNIINNKSKTATTTTTVKTTATITTTATKESNNIRNSNHIEVTPPTAKIEEKEKEPIEVPKEPEVDPIVGRWRMASSENFDEFMKALGVGMMKRKMANSISPHNVISIDESGTYTIRTESTLKTSEIKFKLGETFKEATMDGRVTDSVATREGNIITLVQTGDKSRKEKDSKMVRDFQGDSMFMELTVDDIICKRVYERILE